MVKPIKKVKTVKKKSSTKKATTSDFQEKVGRELKKIRTSLLFHGGDVSLISANKKTGIVKVKFHGRCVGCELLPVTLYYGIEEYLKRKVKGVKKVQAM